jgi:hypothetical protein
VRLVEVTSLDLTVVASLLAVLLGFVVLLTGLEESMRGVVVREVLWPLLVVLCAVYGAISGVQLFQNLTARLRAVLSFGVILRTLLNSVAVLHWCSSSPFVFVPTPFGKPQAMS